MHGTGPFMQAGKHESNELKVALVSAVTAQSDVRHNAQLAARTETNGDCCTVKR